MKFIIKSRRFFILLFVLFFSCKKELEKSNRNIETIKIDVTIKGENVNYHEYFSSSKVLPLETKSESIFSRIDKISLYKDKLFILDRRTNSLLIFNREGKFLNKIKNIGKGPNEYISLTSFAIDEEMENIILYTDRPYGLFIYDFEGVFIRKEKLENLYFNIELMDNEAVLLNKDPKRKYTLFKHDLMGEFQNKFLEMNIKDEIFKNDIIGGRPNLTRDKNIHLTFPYSENIFELKEDKLEIKYTIDFGKHRIPENLYKQKKGFKELFPYARKNNLGFGICNFRENNNYAMFNFQISKLAIYSKKTKETKIIKRFDNEDFIYGSYLAHCGDDNKFISYCPARIFKKQMNFQKKNDESWNKVPNSIKLMDSLITENDNPILLIYTFKE